MKHLLEKWKNTVHGKRITDVVSGAKDRVLSLHKKVLVISIDPDKLKAELKKIELIVAYIATIGAVFSILVVSFHSKANVANFYPSNCLGGWQNPKYAEGLPDVNDNLKMTDFSPENSAVLENSTGQIFCGDFKGEVPQDTIPKKFVLRFSILASDSRMPDHPPFPNLEEVKENVQEIPQNILVEEIKNLPVPDAAIIPELEKKQEEIKEDVKAEPILLQTEAQTDIQPENKDEAPVLVPENAPDTIPPPDSPTSFLRKFISIAFAQEEVTTEEIPSEIIPEATPPSIEIIPIEIAIPQVKINSIFEVKPETTKEVEKVIEEIPIENILPKEAPTQIKDKEDQAVLEIIPVENTTSATISEPAKNEVAGESDYLEVSYTLNGTDWKVLGKISKQNIANPFFEIPFENVNWEDINKVQVSVNSVPSIDKAPIFYLDGMWIEAEYDNLGEKKVKLDKDVILKATSDPLHLYVDSFRYKDELPVSIEAISDPDQGEQIKIGAKTGETIIFTKKDDFNFKFSMPVGDEPIIIPLYQLGAGDFIIKNSGVDGEISFTSISLSSIANSAPADKIDVPIETPREEPKDLVPVVKKDETNSI